MCILTSCKVEFAVIDKYQVDTKDKICKREKSKNLVLSYAYKINYYKVF